MATKALGNISKSQEMRLAAIAAKKKVKDYLIEMAMSRREGERIGEIRGERRGRAEGEKIGEIKGRAEGKIEGRAEGEKLKALAIARVLISERLPVALISKSTGLNVEEIENLKD